MILASAFCTASPLLLVFIFYAGLILTISYCTRIISFASSVNSTHTTFTCSVSLGFGLKVPLYILASFSLLHGLVGSVNKILYSVVLRCWCRLLFLVCTVAGFLIGYYHAPLLEGLQTPFDYLKHSTSLLGKGRVVLRNFVFLERSCVTSFGLAQAPVFCSFIASKG